MAQYRLTKKAIILLVVLFLLVGGGVGGYLYWRLVINPSTVAPTDSDAASDDNYAQRCTSTVLASCDAQRNALPSTTNGHYYCCSSGNITVSRSACEDNAVYPDLIICGDYYVGNISRCHCCDGTWAISDPNDTDTGNDSCEAACGSKGYGDCYSAPVNQACTCTSYEGCGVNCTFPSGTQAQVDAAADGTCGKKMAYCVRDSVGNTTVQIRDVGDCWSQRDICKNPAADDICEGTNVCETGGILTPAASSSYEIGDVISIRGWAADADGINPNTVNVSINGTQVGQADVETACAPDNADPAICTAQGSSKNPIIWTYSYTVVDSGTINISVVWEDTKGVTSSNCSASRAVTADEEGNPDWEMTKTGANVCIDETAGSMEARVDYIITVTNIGSTAGQLNQIQDTLDNKVQSSYIVSSSITPSATVSGNEITWTLTGDDGQFDPDESKQFSYSLIIPEAAFGQYSNTAVGTPDSGSAFSASEVTYATCGDVPDTGLFDSIVFKISLGIILIGASIMYISSRSDIANRITENVADGIGFVASASSRKEVKRKIFERRVTKR